jgi:hypothetical protein
MPLWVSIEREIGEKMNLELKFEYLYEDLLTLIMFSTIESIMHESEVLSFVGIVCAHLIIIFLCLESWGDYFLHHNIVKS